MDDSQPPEPLGYYQGTAPSTPSRVGHLLSFIAGLAVGVVPVVVGGLFCGLRMFESEDKLTLRLITGGWFLLLAACVGLIVWHARRVRRLNTEGGSRAGHHFLLGVLIGGGLMALVEGICFGASSA